MDRARQSGMSLAEYIRRLLVASLEGETPSRSADDPFWSDTEIHTGASPGDLSIRHDDYLYGEAEQRERRVSKVPRRRR